TEVPPEGVVTSGALAPPPAIPAAESTLGSHPCVALSSAQVLPEWINRNLAANDFASDGDYPLNFVSHSRGSLHYQPDCAVQPVGSGGAEAETAVRAGAGSMVNPGVL